MTALGDRIRKSVSIWFLWGRFDVVETLVVFVVASVGLTRAADGIQSAQIRTRPTVSSLSLVDEPSRLADVKKSLTLETQRPQPVSADAAE